MNFGVTLRLCMHPGYNYTTESSRSGHKALWITNTRPQNILLIIVHLWFICRCVTALYIIFPSLNYDTWNMYYFTLWHPGDQLSALFETCICRICVNWPVAERVCMSILTCLHSNILYSQTTRKTVHFTGVIERSHVRRKSIISFMKLNTCYRDYDIMEEC